MRKAATAHDIFVRFYAVKAESFAIDEEAIASHQGKLGNIRTDTAHAVFPRHCACNAVMVRSADDAIA